jgi:regulator of sirC expression with transglutaminase-like and TPR domain
VSTPSLAVERFRRFAAGSSLDIFEGSLAIAQLVDPGEDVAKARARIEELAARVRKGIDAGGRRYEALRRVLFTEEGFCGDTESYDDPANSSVARVLETRRGMPITLSIVTVEAGRRAGLELDGVGLPGHFVVGGRDLPHGLYLDAFEGGKLCDTRQLTEKVSTILGTSVELPPEAFAPDSARAVLMRVLFNLRRSYERRDQFAEALAALECAQALDPADASFHRERGLLLLKGGRSEEALKELESYVAASSGEDAEAVGKLIAIVRDGIDAAGDLRIHADSSEKKIFTLDQARQLLPRVCEITSEAVSRYARLGAGDEAEEERQSIVRDWVRAVASLGAEIKGLWLVDFDSGAGYYCWKYPESSLEYFHGYEEGFAGRLPLQ